jgi:hypothetical protein
MTMQARYPYVLFPTQVACIEANAWAMNLVAAIVRTDPAQSRTRR